METILLQGNKRGIWHYFWKSGWKFSIASLLGIALGTLIVGFVVSLCFGLLFYAVHRLNAWVCHTLKRTQA